MLCMFLWCHQNQNNAFSRYIWYMSNLQNGYNTKVCSSAGLWGFHCFLSPLSKDWNHSGCQEVKCLRPRNPEDKQSKKLRCRYPSTALILTPSLQAFLNAERLISIFWWETFKAFHLHPPRVTVTYTGITKSVCSRSWRKGWATILNWSVVSCFLFNL